MPANRITPEQLREAPLAPGEALCLHRFTDVAEHTDGPDCWCSPMIWTFAETRLTAYRDIQRHLNEFYCVH
jgi:hypothetical protein